MDNLAVMHNGEVVDQLLVYRPVICLSKGQAGDGAWLTGIPYHHGLAPMPPGAMLIDDLETMQRRGWLRVYLWRMISAMVIGVLRRRR